MSYASAPWAFPYHAGTYPSATSPYNHSGSFCIELYLDPTDHWREVNERTGFALKLAVHNNFKWPNGRTITVCFLNGSPYLQCRVMDIANEWTHHANIKFRFVQGPNAEVRIKFTYPGGPSYSQLGTYSLSVPPYQETMALGIADNSPENLIRGTVLHEFGHVLGCVHEHMQPNFPFTWREQVVIAAHGGYCSERMVRDNILNRYTHHQVQASSSFDPDSIMLYYFPPEWTREGHGTQANSNLSQKDKEFISRMYPFPSGPPTYPTHHTRPPSHPVVPYPVVPMTSNICGNPSCGQTTICPDDYNRIMRLQG
ncbi:hypothetical protein BJV74DRAFT_298763 [Russula compacta]|nr:hypothetical protein BJV74DRAFT_298763 [Russula compacta]